MSANDILASLGIQTGVASHPNVDACSNENSLDTYPTGVVTTLAVSACLPMLVLGYSAFRLRRVLAQYIRDHIAYLLAPRAILNFRLEYRFEVRGELDSSIVLESNGTRPETLEDVASNRDEAVEEELSEVVVR